MHFNRQISPSRPSSVFLCPFQVAWRLFGSANLGCLLQKEQCRQARPGWFGWVVFTYALDGHSSLPALCFLMGKETERQILWKRSLFILQHSWQENLRFMTCVQTWLLITDPQESWGQGWESWAPAGVGCHHAHWNFWVTGPP